MNDRNNDVNNGTTTRRRRNVLFGTLAFAAMLVLQGAMPLQAQPNLNFKRVTVNWPTLQLYFSVGCNGTPMYNMSKQDFHIFENGAEIKDFTLWCPDPNPRCALSVALVFDASGSMVGSGNAGAKLGGHAFVDVMDGIIDEATVVWFNSTVTVYQQMTTIKPMLHSAVDALPASGATAVWDGIYAGLIELINNGVNQCRSVVVVTDGGDNSSSRTVAEIISLANRHRIRVFTIGLGSSINAVELEQIAILTGGRYYQTPNAGQLPAIYVEISTIMFQSFQECLITYERDCSDGAIRTVELELRDFCGGSDTKTKSYRAPLDSTTFTVLPMELESVTVTRGSTATVPLTLLTPLSGELLYPMSFTLQYDPTCMEFASVATPPGSLLEGVPMNVTPLSPGRISVQTTGRKVIDGSGTLMAFAFQTPMSDGITCCPVSITDISIQQGCRIPVIDSALVCLVPPDGTAWTCAVTAEPIVVDTVLARYDPMPFEVRVDVTNLGTSPIDSLIARLEFTPDLVFASPDNPSTASKPVLPGPLAAGASAEVTWLLSHPTSMADRSYALRVLVYTPDDTTECMATATIPALILPPFHYDLTVEGALEFCEGDSVVLDGGDYAQWLWNTTDTTRRLTVTQSGQFSCTVTDNQGRVGISNSVRVTMRPKPRPGIMTATQMPICEGESVNLTVIGNYLSYIWSTGDTTRTITVSSAGDFIVEVVDGNGCTGVSNVFTVTAIPAPAKPTVTRNGDVLLSSPEYQYQWLRNGAEIPGATGQFHIAVTTGRYQVRVTNAAGCSAVSDEFDISVLDAGGVPAVVRGFDVYPDPTRGAVTIDLRLDRMETISVLVLNALGQEVTRLDSGQPVRDFRRRIELGDAPGAYFLRITAGTDVWTRRVLRVQ